LSAVRRRGARSDALGAVPGRSEALGGKRRREGARSAEDVGGMDIGRLKTIRRWMGVLRDGGRWREKWKEKKRFRRRLGRERTGAGKREAEKRRGSTPKAAVEMLVAAALTNVKHTLEPCWSLLLQH
jgi:hypothetical protein